MIMKVEDFDDARRDGLHLMRVGQLLPITSSSSILTKSSCMSFLSKMRLIN
jgi:hypothetical protein